MGREVLAQPSRWVAVIDPARCNGCDACLNVCPHDALALERGDAGLRYVSRPAPCGGCDACRAICDRDAIRLAPSAGEACVRVTLFEYTCPGCNARFHRPQAQPTTGPLCRICAGRSSRPGRIVR